MDETGAFLGNVLAVILSIAAIIFCYYVYRQYRLRASSIGWLALSLSLAIILVRRLLVFRAASDAALAQWMDSNEWMILVAISVLQLYAFWRIMGAYNEESRTEFEAVGRLFRLKQKQSGNPLAGRKGKKR